jgi:hypothetical protein
MLRFVEKSAMLEFFGLMLRYLALWLGGARNLPPFAMVLSPHLRVVWIQTMRQANGGSPDFGPAGWCPLTVAFPARGGCVPSSRQNGLRLAFGQAPPFARMGVFFPAAKQEAGARGNRRGEGLPFRRDGDDSGRRLF